MFEGQEAVAPEITSPEVNSVPEPSQAPEGEEVQASETQSEETTQEEGRIPMSRWNAKVKAEKELRSKLGEMENQMRSLEGARALHERLSKDPKALRVVLDLLEGKNADPVNDPYAAYDPETAQLLRDQHSKLDALEQWKQQQEQKERERASHDSDRHRQSLDDAFDGLLAQDGFVKGDGTHDEAAVEMIASATLATMYKIAENPNYPTMSEMREAYKQVTNSLSALSKQQLKKVVTPQNVPPSGSKVGLPMKGNKPQSTEDRINAIMGVLDGAQ